MNKFILPFIITLFLILPIQLFAQIKPGDIVEENISPYLSTPADNYVVRIPVVIICFLPTKNGIDLDVTQASDYWSVGEITLNKLKANINTNNNRIKFSLEEGSRYRGYKDKTVQPYLGYSIIKYITVYEQVPVSNYKIGDDNGTPVYAPDYNAIFERFQLSEIVTAQNVKEVWLWYGEPANPSYPCYNDSIAKTIPKHVSFVESNMSSPTTGDISNSARIIDDLPILGHTYVVYSYNFRRSQAEAIHDHGHQLESILSYINQKQEGSTELFWQKFVGRGPNFEAPIGRCGDTHHPPNTLVDYDYMNNTLVDSDIEGWKPDGGNKKKVNVDTWGKILYNWPGVTDFSQRIETNWYLYWMQNMPGYKNTITYKNSVMTNWWEFTANWDSCIFSNVGLYKSNERSLSDLNINYMTYNQYVQDDHPLFDIGSITDVFDYNTSTLARTQNINPLVITLNFKKPVNLFACKILTVEGDGLWTIEGAQNTNDINNKNGSYKKLINNRNLISGKLDSTSFSTYSCGVIRLTLKRTTGDNYVHLSDWHLFAHYLNLSNDKVEFSYNSNISKTIDLLSDVNWEITNIPNWLIVDKSSGVGNSTITLTAIANTSTTLRVAKLKVSGNESKIDTITISQNAALPELTISTNSVTISATANNSDAFDIISNINWTIINDQNWLTVSSYSGSGNKTITLTALANPTTSSRTATVTISGSGVTSKTITVTQEGATPVLTISTNSLTVSSLANSTKAFDITSNISWTITSDQDWLTVNPNSGSGNKTITLTALANLNTSSRVATLTISGIGLNSKSITVSQSGNTTELTVSADSLKIAATANSSEKFEITSNTNWTLSRNQSWLTASSYSGTGSKNITLTASANPSGNSRVAILTISGNGITSKTIIVTQDGATPALTVSTNNISVPAWNSTKSFNISSNINWLVESSQNWITISNTSGSGNSTVILNILTNPSIEKRTAIVTISGNGISASKIIISQDSSAPSLYVSKWVLTISGAANSQNTFNITSNISWQAKSSQSWLILDNVSGKGNATLTLTALENPTTVSRTATVTISGTGVYTNTINVTQNGADPLLSISTDSINIESDLCTGTFDIISNTRWTVTCDQYWVTASGCSGSGNGKVSFTATLNPMVVARIAKITIYGLGISAKLITVIQKGAKVILNVPETKIDLKEGVNNFSITLTSNTDWTLTSDQNWLDFSQSSGFGNALINMAVFQNNDTSRRTAKLSINAIGADSKTIIVNQFGANKKPMYINVLIKQPGIENCINSLVNSRSDENQIIIYPNPSNNFIILKNENILLNGKIEITIYDHLGKAVIIDEGIINGSFEMQINVSTLSKGLYILKFRFRNDIVVKKIIIE